MEVECLANGSWSQVEFLCISPAERPESTLGGDERYPAQYVDTSADPLEALSLDIVLILVMAAAITLALLVLMASILRRYRSIFSGTLIFYLKSLAGILEKMEVLA